MNYSKIFKREDGTKYDINVSYTGYDWWSIKVYKCLPGKRKFLAIVHCNDYEYRKIDFKDKNDYLINEYLKYVSNEEIRETINEASEQLKNQPFKASVI